MNQLRNPPAAVIALRELITQWRQRAEDLRGNERVNTEDVETEATLHQCADDLDALLARVEPQEVAHESRSPDGDGHGSVGSAAERKASSGSDEWRPGEGFARQQFHRYESRRIARGRETGQDVSPAPTAEGDIVGSEPADSHTHSATARVEPPPQEQDVFATMRASKYLNLECAANGCQWLQLAEVARQLCETVHRCDARSHEYWQAVEQVEAILAAPPAPPTQEPT